MQKSVLSQYNHPIRFYSLALGLVWLFWFIAAYISHLQPLSDNCILAQTVLTLGGLAMPALVALTMILAKRNLRQDFLARFCRRVKPRYWLIAGIVMPLSMVVAQLVSVAFGYSLAQFMLKITKSSFSAGFFSGWFLLLLASVIEELAWHSYGMDTLRNKFNLFNTCIVFTILWAIFHIPLFFIHNSYQSNLLQSNLIYTVNYFAVFFPFVVIANWLYYKTSRTVLIAIILHLTVNISAEIFHPHPVSKIIQTAILLVVALVLIVKDREFFFRRDYQELA